MKSPKNPPRSASAFSPPAMIQNKRLEAFGIYCNAQMTPRTLRRFCKLDSESEKQMENAITRLGLVRPRL